MQSFDLKCEIRKYNWNVIGEVENCEGKIVNNIVSRNETITSVNGRTEPMNLPGLAFYEQNFHSLPQGIVKFFPNLKALSVANSKLKSLTQDDLKPFPQLVYAAFWINDLESLDGNLFELHPKLKYVDFSSNKLKSIGENLLSNLNDLESSKFKSNPCIDANADSSSEVPALIERIKSQCKWPQDPVLIREIEQLKKENADLKSKTNQQTIELNSTKSEIIALKDENARQANSIKQFNATIDELKNKLEFQTKDVATLQDENSKLKRWLRSCDGNLNAVTEILFTSSDRKQNFAQPSSKPIELIVAIDGSKVTTSEAVISSYGSKVNSIKYSNTTIINSEPPELYIDHQQTLFLPTNLGQYFPALRVLAVTSSGLMQIDSSIFRLITSLKVLNLSSNKLQEIQPGTFDVLKLLESLDLSSNNLKSLETGAISGLEKLKNLNLADNRLKVISSNILDPLKVLQIADLSKNDCINLSFPKVTRKEIEDQLIKDCMASVEIECSMRGTDCKAVNMTIMHPKTKISKLKNQIGVDSFTFSIIDQSVAFLPLQLNKIFTNLRVLIVSRSKLIALNQRVFEGLTGLTSITISFNNISLIESGVFDVVPQLENLNLSYNNIKTLPSMIFVKLAKLKTLNLSENQLQSFLSEYLPQNSAIEELHIKENELIRINLANSINLKNVKIVDLADNICINMRYEKGKAGGKTLPNLIQALQVCKN